MADAEPDPATHDLTTTFLHLAATGVVTPLPVGPDFWANIPSILSSGRMVSLFKHDGDWSGWERHPAGDEVVAVLTGRMRFRLELPDGEVTVEVPAGRCVVVPKGVWHTADVSEPSSALFITEGHGTENRPR